MKYSFVLPAYKSTFLKRAIDSILSQTYVDFELVVVDDASPEALDSIVSTYTDRRIRYYVNEENLGGKDLVAQWNKSLSYAKGDYVILASDDDLYDSTYLFKMDELVNKYPNADVFRPRVRYIDEKGELLCVDGYLKEMCTGLDVLDAWTRGWIGSGIPFYIFKRSSLISVDGFAQYPLAWFSDDMTMLRLSKNGVVSSSELLFSFRLSGVGISTKLNTYENLIQKIDATELFYKEIVQIIEDAPLIDEYDHLLKKDLQKRLPCFIQRDKLCGQLSNASLNAMIRSYRKVLKLGFISRKQILVFYMLNITRRCIGSLSNIFK
jgi:glycosyltransferase involved in cell wall biosynthesis